MKGSIIDSYKESLLHEYDQFRCQMDKMDITINRKVWQPQVMLEKHWPKDQFSRLAQKLSEYPELNVNCAVEYIKYDHYVASDRFLRKSFPQIVLHTKNPMLMLFFPKSYNTESLALELSLLDHPYKMPHPLRDSIIRQLQDMFTRYWPEYYMKFIPYGSQLVGLGFPNSPLNICIEMDEPDLHRLIENSDPLLNDLGEPYCTATTFNLFKRIGGDKFQHDTNTDFVRMKLEEYNVEYNFNKEIYTESTNLIHQYILLDPRVKPFLYALKIFGRGRNIFASQVSNGIRYYGYTIMALSYLSQLDPPIIPNLQHINPYNHHDDCHVESCNSKQKYWDKIYQQGQEIGIAARYHDCVRYDPTQPPTTYHLEQNDTTGQLYWNSSNHSNLGELFMDFLYYYGYQFDYSMFAVSLKFEGKIPQKTEWAKDQISIEDPFLAQINLGAPVKELSKVRRVFRGAFTVLHSGISFENLYKKIADITKYDSPRGIKNDRPIYDPLPTRQQVEAHTSKVFILIGLPKAQDLNCYCDRIRKLFTSHGTITEMLDLDDTTKMVYFTATADTNNVKDIVLPFTFTLDGQTVHLVELYDYTPSST